MEELILKEREVREQVVQIINNSGLPAFILKPIFKDFYEQINNFETQQYEIARKNRDDKEKTSKNEIVKKGEKDGQN